MKKVITYGTFDLFHIGHLNLLKRAKALGDYLIVAVSSDDFNLREKGKVCQIKDVDRIDVYKRQAVYHRGGCACVRRCAAGIEKA